MTTGESAGAGAYDAFAYPGFAYPQAHPVRLATNALLRGLRPPDVTTARVLELGCGDGGNLIPAALALPGSTCVGIDASGAAVARGRMVIEEAGITNVSLIEGDLAALPDDLGEFDYVIAHGVYSWVPDPIRDALMEACRSRLAMNGVAYVSYNAYPGGHIRQMVREIMRFHVREISDGAERLREARALMQLIASSDDGSAYAEVLRQQAERLLAQNDPLIVHDDLADHNRPVYFHEFVRHAGDHDLQFLCEADLGDSQMGLSDEIAGALEQLGDDVLTREQYMDFVRNRTFRQTLLVGVEHILDTNLHVEMVPGLYVGGEISERPPGPETAGAAGVFGGAVGGAVTTYEPVVAAALRMIANAWPVALPVRTLLGEARQACGSTKPIEHDANELVDLLLRAHLGSVLELRAAPPPVPAEIAERPVASRLARAELRLGRSSGTSLRHQNVELAGTFTGRVLALLDGTRDREALVAALADLGPPPGLELGRAVDAELERLQRMSLLEA